MTLSKGIASSLYPSQWKKYEQSAALSFSVCDSRDVWGMNVWTHSQLDALDVSHSTFALTVHLVIVMFKVPLRSKMCFFSCSFIWTLVQNDVCADTQESCSHIHCSLFSGPKGNWIFGGRPTSMICDITNCLEADSCPIFSVHKCDVEKDLDFTSKEETSCVQLSHLWN